jgi:hypothetical protein
VGGTLACAALEHDAQLIAPELHAACALAEDASGQNPWVDFSCLGLEAADKLIASVPQGAASKVSSNTLLAPDGGTVATTYRVRVLVSAAAMNPFFKDGGVQ